ncbi:hypothetical protein BKA70DRAFT_1574578 [Coprinopsis sp. MPI-PUGE-AT-0042]|nr:hypothetical protein BKA70DRAFT_1574578 [Coprinopsis sp. MPI-PUGE-AT-0042]
MSSELGGRVNISVLLAGSYVQVALLAIHTVMLRTYLSADPTDRQKRDPMRVRVSVLFCFAVNVVNGFAACAVVYDLVYRYWGSPQFIGSLDWPHTLCVFSSCVNAWVVQFFMTYRYWSFSKNAYVAGFLLILSLTSFVSFTVAVAYAIIWNQMDERGKHLDMVIVALSTAAATDIGITAALIQKLWSTQTYTPQARSTVMRITKLALITGVGPMLFSIIILIAFITKPKELIATGIAMPIGSVYACTMLYTLNRRGYLRGDGMNSFRDSILDSQLGQMSIVQHSTVSVDPPKWKSSGSSGSGGSRRIPTLSFTAGSPSKGCHSPTADLESGRSGRFSTQVVSSRLSPLPQECSIGEDLEQEDRKNGGRGSSRDDLEGVITTPPTSGSMVFNARNSVASSNVIA